MEITLDKAISSADIRGFWPVLALFSKLKVGEV